MAARDATTRSSSTTGNRSPTTIVKILEALNKRVKLVKSLKDYKEAQGLSFYDAAQEDWVITYLCRANRGPLSNEGLREIYQLILQVAKREAAALSDKERAESAQS